jgi:hypothetical protein
MQDYSTYLLCFICRDIKYLAINCISDLKFEDLFLNVNLEYLLAMHAFIKQDTVPAIMALTTTCASADLWFGAIAPSAPNTIPIDDMLANPQRAYVVITTDRSWR